MESYSFTLPCLQEEAAKGSNSNLQGREFHCIPLPCNHHPDSTPCLPVSLLTPATSDSPGSLASPMQFQADSSPESPGFQATLASTVHYPISPDCAVSSLPLFPLHTNLPPQIQLFSGYSLCLPPCTGPSPQILLFLGSPIFPWYTNWPPWVQQFPEPPCSLTRQLHLPRFSCFQAPLICPVHRYLSQVLLFLGFPVSPVYASVSSLC